MNVMRRQLLLLLVGTGLAAGVLAQTPVAEESAGVTWNELSPQQQQVLKNFQQQWATLPPERQRRLSQGAARWSDLTPEQKQQARARFRKWQQLP